MSSSDVPFILVLTTSAHVDDTSTYATPMRKVGDSLIRGYVVSTEYDTRAILERYGGSATHIFYDIEKKTVPKVLGREFNLERLVVSSEYKEKSVPFKPNDVTVSAVMDNIINVLGRREKGLGGLHACVFGIGNIGFKTSLSLVEAGVEVTLVGRSFAKAELMANAINQVKPRATLAVAKAARAVGHALVGKDVLITCASQSAVIFRHDVDRAESLTMALDVGKQNLSSDAIEYLLQTNRKVQRLSITNALVRYVAGALYLSNHGDEPIGRGKALGRNVVSGGMIGGRGDWIVDDYRNPSCWLGIADGRGGFARRKKNA